MKRSNATNQSSEWVQHMGQSLFSPLGFGTTQSSWIHLEQMHWIHSLPVPLSSSKELKQTQHKSVNMLLSIVTFDLLCRVRLLVILLSPPTKFKCPSFVEVSVVTSRERFLPVTALCSKLFSAFSNYLGLTKNAICQTSCYQKKKNAPLIITMVICLTFDRHTGSKWSITLGKNIINLTAYWSNPLLQ